MVCDIQRMTPREVRDSVGLVLIMRRVDYPTEAMRKDDFQKETVT